MQTTGQEKLGIANMKKYINLENKIKKIQEEIEQASLQEQEIQKRQPGDDSMVSAMTSGGQGTVVYAGRRGPLIRPRVSNQTTTEVPVGRGTSAGRNANPRKKPDNPVETPTEPTVVPIRPPARPADPRPGTPVPRQPSRQPGRPVPRPSIQPAPGPLRTPARPTPTPVRPTPETPPATPAKPARPRLPQVPDQPPATPAPNLPKVPEQPTIPTPDVVPPTVPTPGPAPKTPPVPEMPPVQVPDTPPVKVPETETPGQAPATGPTVVPTPVPRVNTRTTGGKGEGKKPITPLAFDPFIFNPRKGGTGPSKGSSVDIYRHIADPYIFREENEEVLKKENEKRAKKAQIKYKIYEGNELSKVAAKKIKELKKEKKQENSQVIIHPKTKDNVQDDV